MTLGREVICDLLNQFPNAGSSSVARMAYKNNPSLFTSLEAARCSVRRVRGAMGEDHGYMSVKQFVRPKQQPGNAFPLLPEGKKHFDQWQPIVFDGPMRALVLADLHIPYHERSAIVNALEFGKKNDANMIVMNGDIADFFSVSFWEKDPRKRNFAEELKTVKSFIAEVRAQFPKARIVYKAGNHEERWQRYMFVKAPELLGVPEFKLTPMLGLLPGELIEDKQPIRLGHLNIIHGHEYVFAISNPVNPARGLFLRCKAYALCGHFHQSSAHSEKTVEQRNVGTWSAGCLCDLHPDYRPMNNWNHGFAYVEVYSDGKFTVQNKYLSGNRLY